MKVDFCFLQLWLSRAVQQPRVHRTTPLCRLPVGATMETEPELELMTWSCNTEISCGVLAGFFASIVAHPLDTLAAAQQIVTSLGVLGPLDAARKLYSERGASVFGAATMVCAIGTAVCYACYFWLNHTFQTILGGSDVAINSDPSIAFWALIAAGMTTTCVVTPFWVVKHRQQRDAVAGKTGGPNWVMLSAEIVRSEGLLALWSGLAPGLMGALEGACQWVLLAKVRDTFEVEPSLAADFRKSLVPCSAQKSIPHTVPRAAVLGAGARVAGAVITYPTYIVRARLQARTTPGGVVAVIKEILQEGGVRGLYAGLYALLPFQIVIGGALTMAADLCRRGLMDTCS